jgi:5'-nucleotidase
MRRTIVCITLVLVACTRGISGPPTVAPPPPDDARISILHFNDVYEITPVEGGRSGGLARVATVRKQLLARGISLLTTLGGDFLSPSALGTARVDGEILAGKHMVAVLNAVGLDWTTLGNHEFDIAEPLFRARLAESKFRYVVSNVTDTLGRPFPGVVPHAIVSLDAQGRRIRIGLVGTLLPATRAPWVRYENQYDAVARHVAMIRDSVDAVIAITHQYYYEDDRLASEVPGIDVILGGHEHDNFLLRRGRDLTPIVKSDGNVRSVQVVTLNFGPPGRRPVVTTELVPITDAIAEDAGVKQEVDRWLNAAFAGYIRDGFAPREIVTTLTEPLDARESSIRARSTNMTELMLAALKREAPDAEVGLFNAGSLRIDDVVAAGPITQYDIIRILPFGGPLVRAEVSGRVLSQAVTIGRRNFGIGGFIHTFGATIENERVLVNGQPVDPDRKYVVVTTDFLLTGREANLGFFSRDNPEITGERNLRDVRIPLIEELKARAGRP